MSQFKFPIRTQQDKFYSNFECEKPEDYPFKNYKDNYQESDFLLKIKFNNLNNKGFLVIPYYSNFFAKEIKGQWYIIFYSVQKFKKFKFANRLSKEDYPNSIVITSSELKKTHLISIINAINEAGEADSKNKFVTVKRNGKFYKEKKKHTAINAAEKVKQWENGKYNFVPLNENFNGLSINFKYLSIGFVKIPNIKSIQNGLKLDKVGDWFWYDPYYILTNINMENKQKQLLNIGKDYVPKDKKSLISLRVWIKKQKILIDTVLKVPPKDKRIQEVNLQNRGLIVWNFAQQFNSSFKKIAVTETVTIKASSEFEWFFQPSNSSKPFDTSTASYVADRSKSIAVNAFLSNQINYSVRVKGRNGSPEVKAKLDSENIATIAIFDKKNQLLDAISYDFSQFGNADYILSLYKKYLNLEKEFEKLVDKKVAGSKYKLGQHYSEFLKINQLLGVKKRDIIPDKYNEIKPEWFTNKLVNGFTSLYKSEIALQKSIDLICSALYSSNLINNLKELKREQIDALTVIITKLGSNKKVIKTIKEIFGGTFGHNSNQTNIPTSNVQKSFNERNSDINTNSNLILFYGVILKILSLDFKKSNPKKDGTIKKELNLYLNIVNKTPTDKFFEYFEFTGVLFSKSASILEDDFLKEDRKKLESLKGHEKVVVEHKIQQFKTILYFFDVLGTSISIINKIRKKGGNISTKDILDFTKDAVETINKLYELTELSKTASHQILFKDKDIISKLVRSNISNSTTGLLKTVGNITTVIEISENLNNASDLYALGDDDAADVLIYSSMISYVGLVLSLVVLNPLVGIGLFLLSQAVIHFFGKSKSYFVLFIEHSINGIKAAEIKEEILKIEASGESKINKALAIEKLDTLYFRVFYDNVAVQNAYLNSFLPDKEIKYSNPTYSEIKDLERKDYKYFMSFKPKMFSKESTVIIQINGEFSNWSGSVFVPEGYKTAWYEFKLKNLKVRKHIIWKRGNRFNEYWDSESKFYKSFMLIEPVKINNDVVGLNLLVRKYSFLETPKYTIDLKHPLCIWISHEKINKLDFSKGSLVIKKPED